MSLAKCINVRPEEEKFSQFTCSEFSYFATDEKRIIEVKHELGPKKKLCPDICDPLAFHAIINIEVVMVLFGYSNCGMLKTNEKEK
jgi:predicted secreted protein